MHQFLHCRDARRREKGPEKISEEIPTVNFPNMGKEIVNQVQDTKGIRTNPRRNTPRHIVIKQTKIKDKTNKGKKTTYKGNPMLSANFSTETLQARKEWHNIFQVISASTDPTCAPGLQRQLPKVAGWPLRAP